MAKNGAEGVLSEDPRINPDAKLIKKISYIDLLKKNLKVMDNTAISLLSESDIELRVFNINDLNNFKRVMNGEDVGTTIRKE